MKSAYFSDDLVASSKFGIIISKNGSSEFLTNNDRNIEIERIEEKYKDNTIFYLRVRNASKKPIKINSFVISEFFMSNKGVKEIMENNWLQCSEIGYKKLNYQTKRNMGFLQRDQNPYSFLKEYGYVEGSIISEWFTCLRYKEESLFIGAVTTGDQFSQIYIKNNEVDMFIRITSQYDGITLKPGQVVKSEKIFLKLGKEGLIQTEFAKILSYYMKVKRVLPPIRAMCCSYYWNKNKITEEIINNELDSIQKINEGINFDYIQLDAGYTRYFGDWTDYKERFPNGFSNIVSRIRSLGYEAGIWISPFAINPGTRLHDHHKSWLIKNGHKKHFEGRWTSPFDTLSNEVDLEVLDPTKDEVKDYLRQVLLHFKKEGFRLFKLDFMYPLCLSNNFSKGVTRAQALREGIQLIRSVLGEECLILSGISQLSPLVGLVDYVRTGIDTMNPFVENLPGIKSWVNNFMLKNNIEESKLRLFLNGVVWRADPDCLVFNGHSGLDIELIKEHKKLAKENKMSLWIGDSIAQIDDDHKREIINFLKE